MVDPADWGMTADQARAELERRICPICGEGPWNSPLNHVSRRHGIDRHTMRDVCGLSSRDKVTALKTRAKFAANGRDRVDVLARNSEATRGTKGKKARQTKALKASRETNPLLVWIAEHPEEMAQMRRGFRGRMEGAEDSWRDGMRPIWDAQRKLSPAQLDDLLRRRRNGESLGSLAARFGIGKTTVARLVKRGPQED